MKTSFDKVHRADQPTPILLGQGVHLFVDDYLIAASQELTRTTHQPEKRPAPVLCKGESWHLQPQWFLRVARDRQTGLFQTWYNLKNPGGHPNICYAYAQSPDGIDWERPPLGLVEVDGSTANNLIAAPQGHFGLFMADDGPDSADPARRFKLGYYDEGLCVAVSPDGFRFAEYPGNPVIPAHAPNTSFYQPGYENYIGDIIDGCWDPHHQEYLLGCKIEQGGYPGQAHHHAPGWRRCVGVSASQDFVTWPRPRLIVTPDPANGIEEFYGFKPMVRGDLYLGFLRVLRDDLPADEGGPVEGIGWTELLTSRNGRDWQRHPQPFLDRDPRPGRWDHAMAWFADCLTVGDREYIYYGGYSAGHKVGDREVGLARLRKDGFVSRDAGVRRGTLCTPVVQLAEATLAVNAAVDGELRVRLLAPDYAPLPGFDWTDGAPVRGDAVAHPLSWRNDPRRLAGAPLRLEFSLERGELYGFEVGRV